MRVVPRIMRAAAFAATLSIASQQALAEDCALQDEQAALDARVLQTELVVAALNCGRNADYNAFATKFQEVLIAYGAAFRNYFTRVYGPGGEEEMNLMVTRLANVAVVRSWSWGSNGVYCENEASMFSYVMALDPSQFAGFAASRPYATDHDVQLCPIPPPVQAETQPSP